MAALPPSPPLPPDVPAASSVAPSRPTWTYFLMPGSVLLGALLVAASIWWAWGRDEGSGGTPAAAAGVSAVNNGSSAVAPANLVTAFSNYAKQAGVTDDDKFRACLQSQPDAAIITKQLQRGIDNGVEGTPTFFINNKRLVGSQPRAVFEEVINAELKGSPATLDGYSDAVKALIQKNQFSIVQNRVDVSDAVFEGNPKAKVIVAEFTDFQCPFCQRWEQENLQWLRGKLGNDVALAFLHMPLTQIHPNAGYASLAAVCAGNQGKFWPMHDLLFARQQEWQSLKP